MKSSRQKWLPVMAAVAIAVLVCCPVVCAKDHRADDFGDHLEHLIEHVMPDPPPKPPPVVVVPPPPPPAQVVTVPPPTPPVEGPLVIDNVTGYASDPGTGRVVVIRTDGFIREYNTGTRGVRINWATGIEGPPEIIRRPPRPPRTTAGVSGASGAGGSGGVSGTGGTSGG